MTYEELTQRIQSGTPTHLSRWGDGEFLCIKNVNEPLDRQMNTDKHKYYKSLGQQLMMVLDGYEMNDDYYLAMQPKAYREISDVREIWADRVDSTWPNADILHNASIDGRLNEFISALENKSVIIVGPERLRKVNTIGVPYEQFVPIRDVNCWLDFDYVMKVLPTLISTDKVILYSASMMTNVLIDRMYRSNLLNFTQIDCGSVWEPYIGHSNRKYHQRILDRINIKL